MDCIFLDSKIVKLLHKMQIDNFGGSHGLRDEGMLESALSRPINKAEYGTENICELAAAYVFGLAKNHPFVDGNKRIAIVTAGVFLMENGYMIETDDGRLYEFVVGIAAGEINEDGISRFLSDHVIALP